MARFTILLSALTCAIFVDKFIVAQDPFADEFQSQTEKYDYEMSDDPYTKNKQFKAPGKKLTFKGGCPSMPYSIGQRFKGQLSCSSEGWCRGTCAKGYRFPNGEQEITIVCRDMNWQVQGADYDDPPHCEPICLPECKNSGICVGPNECNCPENFSGSQCQFENTPCLNEPALIPNAERRCSSKSCTITCNKNFVFPDGSSVANLICKHGNWEPTRSDWVTVPGCQPVCTPPCQNEGFCLSLNVCQCPQDFRGPQCQYRKDSCSEERLGFNGVYQCGNLDEHSYSCSLSCPAGVPFEFPPAAMYVCRYETGQFEPQPIPQCLPPIGSRIMSVNNYELSSYIETNHSHQQSWSISGGSAGSKQSSNGFSSHDFSSSSSGSMSGAGMGLDMLFGGYGLGWDNMEKFVKKKESGSCFAWAGVHYKTFDGKIYSFESRCSYTLLKDTQDGLFTVTVQNDPSCETEFADVPAARCPRVIRIFVQGKEYSLSLSKSGQPELRTSKKELPIPSQLAHLRVEETSGGQFILASLDAVGLRIRWDAGSLVQVEASEALWNRTAGLCGTLNGEREDDYGLDMKSPMHLANTWRLDNLGDKCEEYSSQSSGCSSDPDLEFKASEFCSQLLSDSRYSSCAALVDLSGFEAACRWDYCNCQDEDRRSCACETMGVYVRQCAHKGMVSLAGWRDNSICPMRCRYGKVYMACGPKTQPSCGAELEKEPFDASNELSSSCEEGCFCPVGTVLHEGRCINRDECPCQLRGKSFSPGSSVSKDCNSCACVKGRWTCTESKCSARCSAVGDPHYTTFDGKRYDFMGQCSYYLLKGPDYSVEGENAHCSSAISEMMGYVRSYQDGEPSCTKTVTIRVNNVAIKLKQNHQILVNGEDVTKLPMLAGGARVRIVSSIFISVELPNGIEVLWDGVSRVYINAPPQFRGETRGLCGTFTSNQKDDFLTPDGDVEQAVVAFANKWKTNEQCSDVRKDSDHPCELNPQKRSAAERYCSSLKKQLFSSCHWHVDPEPFYKDCLYDMCACEMNVDTCLCPTLAAYAKDCAQVGVVIPWRQEVHECRVHCPGDQEYQVCGSSCTRSCADISFLEDCKEECVEGCNCPKGFTLDVNGECIPIGQCPCTHGEIEFLAGYREVRPGPKGQELCTCAGGRWNCQLANENEIAEYPAVTSLKSLCSATRHQEVTTCEPAEPRTCRNMHRRASQSPAICRPGCVCKTGYVLDLPSGECVEEKQCPCYHGGQSYKEGSRMQQECNSCQCSAGRWKCTDIICPGVCTVWGDSHYETFDDRQYDFQGVCDYVLAKGRLSDAESFDITVRNVACGTTGVTCSKAVTLTVGRSYNAEQESFTLTRGKSITAENFRGLGRIAMRRAGLFVFLDVPDLGLVLQWDEGTRVYVRLDAKWKGLTKGLCGDFNDNAEDDFKTPSGGMSEASASLFGDSWKMNELCGQPSPVQPDTCGKHPERRLWATQKCRIMKSDLFEACHTEIPPESYIEKCIYDACGCDDGGDCECLCTAIASYAQACNARGVPIQWRSQKLCPMQCDESSSSYYSACVSTCPRETCENLATRSDSLHLCDQDVCVEGCQPKLCPDGYVYLNSTFGECVPRASCKTPCAIIEGVEYFEGDRTGGDECHSCFCSRGKEVCKGTPCVPSTLPPVFDTTTAMPFRPYTVENIRDQQKNCINGWSKWFNRDWPKSDGFRNDIENIPDLIEMLEDDSSAVCDRDKMTDIQCRTADTKLSYKEVGLNVECSLENGFMCLLDRRLNLSCPDFEIRVLCRCEELPITTTAPLTEFCRLDELYRAVAENCQEFLQCGPGLYGNEWVRKICGPGTMFNERLQICDWPTNVAVVRPECGIVTTTEQIVTESICPEGERWSDCAIQCTKTCEYFNHLLRLEGTCARGIDCVPGCVPVAREDCPPFKYWRDRFTCVDRSDCMCKTDYGEPVKPGTIVNVSECKFCQCINNYFSCDESGCETNEIERNKTVVPEKKKEPLVAIIIPSTVTPPSECESENYGWMVEKTPFDVAYNASSFESPFLTADTARLRRTASMLTWKPEVNDYRQWVEIKFDRARPIYGVVVRGDSFEDKYVTSYKVLYSEDGQVFSYVTEAGTTDTPKVLSGPVDSFNPVMQIFHPPIEAKVVRINPVTWHEAIAMQVDLVDCEEETPVTTEVYTTTTTTRVITETVIIPVCEDPMGYDDYIMSDQQVTVSSSSFNTISPNLRLSSLEIWSPSMDNPDQYVQFDFLEPRNLTGIETKGGNDIWTTAYKVHYSIDGKNWNPILDESGAEKEFLANVDDYNSKVNYFKRPVGARFIRILPTKWHRHIGLKVEILGCFVPYPPTTAMPFITTTPPSECNICPGIKVHNANKCKCKGSMWWDGFTCVAKPECPCVYEHITYSVGSTFETYDCQFCLCTLGGNPVCQPKACDPCPSPNDRPVLTELCGCICKPCPAGQRLCPSSPNQICIDEKKWCDGVQDCPDDETGCKKIVAEVTETGETTRTKNTTTTINIACQTTCPPGFELENPEAVGTGTSFDFTVTTSETVKTSFKKVFKVTMPAAAPSFSSRLGGDEAEDQLCPKIVCVPKQKDKLVKEKQCNLVCPPGFQPLYDRSKSYRKTDNCDNVCVPIPPKERICNIVGRTFTTFDNLEYKYDICNHILARDRYANRWYIVAEKVCHEKEFSCQTTLLVTFDGHEIVLLQDMHAYVDGNYYSPSETKRLGDKYPWMKLSRVGNSLRVESKHYPFWALLDSNGGIKIGVSEELAGHADGMCGYFDGEAQNDQQTPQGLPAKSTKDFADSWKIDDSAECKLKVCPEEIQGEAWKTCNLVKDSSFEACSAVVNREKFASSCLADSCACLSSGNTTRQECRCRVLTSFVSQCLAGNSSIDLSTWRSIHDCQASCDAPFVHKDCFRNTCEMNCGNLQDFGDPCPVMDGLCVTGCFCPDGLVRNGDTCVPPTECRDCVCDGFGNSKYVTFDRKNLLFEGNCTYLLSRNIPSLLDGGDNGHLYEVYVTNGGCPEGICIQKITILLQNHKVEVGKSDIQDQLVSFVDDQLVQPLPFKSSWLLLEETPNRDIRLLMPVIQLELICFKHDFSFMLRLPSHTFGGSMEGLCGDCNGNPKNDFKMSNNELTEDMQEFGNSWLLKTTEEQDRRCLNKIEERPRCSNEPAAERYCSALFLSEAFSRCHGLVDPTPYYLACKDTMCDGGSPCINFEAYARTCSIAGLCLDWRSWEVCPYACPSHLEYRSCHSGCPETCETLEHPEFCLASPVEGCFCPEDHIMHNDTCIPKRQCLVCDPEGHIEGDLWMPNKCTQCTCQNRVVMCQETNCPAIETVCDENSNPVVVPGTENDCCPKYLCVPVPVVPTVCPEESLQPDCGYGQSLRTTTDGNGCQKFICQCVPEDQCASLDVEAAIANEILEPGFVKVTDSSGCCPRTSKVCKPEICPPSPECQKYYKPVVKEAPNACCPVIECQPPTDMCVYYSDSSNELNFLEKALAKNIGEIWLDGNCKTCTCEINDGIPSARCTTKECLNIMDHLDNFNFVLEEVPVDNQCCPNIERIACRQEDRIYKIGDKWYPTPSDKCINTECAMDKEGVTKRTMIQECPETCDLGYVYRQSLDKSVTCCGECVPVACVVDGQLKTIGEFWYSEDFCILSNCQLINGSIHIESQRDFCESVDPMDELDYKIEKQKIYGKCCPEITRTGCLSDGEFHGIGETWKSPIDACILETCKQNADGKITKLKEVQTCHTDCPKGWEYEEPESGTCCGKCKQTFCVLDDILYQPGMTWESSDNCTTYSCVEKDDQLLVSTSSAVCPELNCSPDLIYIDGCCKKCNISTENQLEHACAAEVIDYQETVGIIVLKKGIHGICTNMEPIQGLTECHGQCKSSTHFDSNTWEQIIDCKCCKPVDYRQIDVELTCEDGYRLEKIVTVPTKCSCDQCKSAAELHKLQRWLKENAHIGVKT